jgi:hypothetical protein
MSASLRDRLGPLGERNFRLLFSATTISTLGDGLADIALAFAVLEISDSPVALGVVLAARMTVEVAVTLLGGVLSDRLPRQLVLVGASLVQAASQAATAAIVLGGTGSVAWIVVTQSLYGLGSGLVWPAEVGLVPQTVGEERLQQANALQGLTRDAVRVIGPAAGGALVVAGSPGLALAVDSASFLVCAALLARIRVAAVPRAEARPGFLDEFRAGWREFTAHTWLWTAIVGFSIATFAYSAWIVLGPVLAKAELGGAGAWATILAAGGAGAVAGGLFALRYRPQRPLVAAVVLVLPVVAEMVALALLLPVWVIAVASFAGGAGLAIHIALWFTVFQQQVAPEALSRVSSYDALGSFVLMPLGFAVAGPVAGAIGTRETLWIAAALELASLAAILLVPSVWSIRRTPGTPERVPA